MKINEVEDLKAKIDIKIYTTSDGASKTLLKNHANSLKRILENYNAGTSKDKNREITSDDEKEVNKIYAELQDELND